MPNCELTFLQTHITMFLGLGIFVLTFHLVMRLFKERIGSPENDLLGRRRARASSTAVAFLAGLFVMTVFLSYTRDLLC
mgnify:CR=1 FL=1